MGNSRPLTAILLLGCCAGLFASEITSLPAQVAIQGPRSNQRIITVLRDQGREQFVFPQQLRFESSEPKVATVTTEGVIHPRGNGQCTITVTAKSGHNCKIEVTVKDFEKPAPIEFHNEVIPALSRGGCSQGACHGSPQGKNGFRLSLRGFEPSLDAAQLSRGELGRRINRVEPAKSLLLAKGTARVPHQGGRRFKTSDPAYQVLLQWIEQGGKTEQEVPKFERLEVLPKSLALDERSPRSQLIALAHFEDGTVRDVTDLAVFSTPSKEAVEVTAQGEVQFTSTAETVVLVRYLDRIESVNLSYIERDSNYAFKSPAIVNEVDRHVFAKQRQLQLKPAQLSDDATFLRRIYLDLVGAIPTPEEARQFLESKDKGKRDKLIDELLNRKDFAAFWALKWADVMKGNRETISLRGVHTLHRYLVRNFSNDRSFRDIATEILTSRGNTIHVPQANFYRISRTPTETAESFSQLFLGVRIGCAKCHNHPYESISQRNYYEMAAFFSRVQLKGKRFGLDDEVVFLSPKGEVQMPGSDKDLAPAAFGMAIDNSAESQEDRRRFLAQWLTSEQNPYFAQSTVNRIWYHLMGQGLVDPVDDFRTTNPASNPELLKHLSATFVKNNYRFKPVIREILRSSTYQLSSKEASEQSKLAAAEERYFTKPVVRLLSAEQIIDAISNASGVPEKFPGYPLGTRAVQLAEGDINHQLLKAFTRPVRDVGCDCARETEPTLNQIIHLINNPSVLGKIDSPKSRLSRWLEKKLPTSKIIENMYLASLSRFPSEAEHKVAASHIAESDSLQAALRDLQHALWNSNEFLLRH